METNTTEDGGEEKGSTMAEKTAHYYRRLPYTRRVEPLCYRAWIEELPSIEICGDSQEDALARLRDIFDDCIETMIEAGDDIPEPNLWPTGLFRREASDNLRWLIRETEVNQTTAQVAATTHEELAGQIEPWTPIESYLGPDGPSLLAPTRAPYRSLP